MQDKKYNQFNCYKVLEIPSTASLPEIRAAYYRLCKIYHPDSGGTHEAQVKLNLAFEILKNPLDRLSHDTYWLRNQQDSFVRPKSTYQYRTQYSPNRPKESQQEPRSARTTPPRSEPLSGLKNRVHKKVEEEKKKIWEELNNRTCKNLINCMREYSNKRNETFALFGVVTILIIFAIQLKSILLGVGVLLFGGRLISNLSGVIIEGGSFSIFDSRSQEKIKEHANNMARESCAKDTKKLDRHFASLANLTELLLRSSTFDDSEEQVARRLTASFFLMGYVPLQYDRENRTLLFSDGEEKILIRFRHRSGIATNITYVKKLVSLMMIHGATTGYIFCSPGLSGNAASYANTHGVKWYKLEPMNNWINQVLSSNYSGPSGDILSYLDKLRSFIADISPVLPGRNRKSGYRYNRYRH